jgi:hypothetical protein
MNSTLPALPRALSVLALAFTAFVLAAALPPAAGAVGPGSFGPPRLGLFWTPLPAQPCAGDSISLRFDLCECNVEILDVERDSGEGLVLRLRAQPNLECVQCVPDSAEVSLGVLPAGRHALTVRIEIEYTAPPDTSWPASPAYDALVFGVLGEDCGPNPGTVRYLDSVVIAPPACVGDSITLHLAGTFPSHCVRLSAVENLGHQIPGTNPPTLDTIRLIYANQSMCAFCLPGPVPWSASIKVRSPAEGGLHGIPLVAYERNLCSPDTIGVQFAGTKMIPVSVADSCGTPPPPFDCFNVSWRPDSTAGRCDATYGKTQAAELVFRVGSTIPIAGVQGGLRLDDDRLHIASVTAARDGWAVQTSPNPAGGVNFIAFATSPGAAIPGRPQGEPQPLLHVVVDQHVVRDDDRLPERAHLAAERLLVSGTAGQAIPMCPVIALIDPPPTVALLCLDRRCDVNEDGRSDVRDLVVMVGCMELSSGPDCPVGRMDCDGNGAVSLEDVFCCATHMLGGDGPAPPDSVLREAPELALRFGLPRERPDGSIEVPLDVTGLDAAAAARFDVAWPDARYVLEAVEFAGFDARWWASFSIRAERAGVMLLDLSRMGDPRPVAAAGGGSGTVLLKLRLLDGATPGGELSIAGFDFADPAGAGLTTPNASPRLPLGSTGALVLAAPRPNPFRTGTAITLTFPAAGAIDAAVYNAAGRRIATLRKEENLAPGAYELTWDGRDAGGARVPGGVYFVRVISGAGETSRKLLFLPGAMP